MLRQNNYDIHSAYRLFSTHERYLKYLEKLKETKPKQIIVERPVFNTSQGFFTEGGQLYDANGIEFMARGVNSTHVWFDVNLDPIEEALGSIDNIAKFGFNSTRIVWQMRFLDRDTDDLVLERILLSNIQQGMIPVLGLWDYTGGNDWNNFFKIIDWYIARAEVWKRYEKELIINLANEWGNFAMSFEQGEAGRRLFATMYKRAVNLLRSAGINNTLIIDTFNYCKDWTLIRDYGQEIIDSDPQHNIVFSEHYYCGDGESEAQITTNLETIRSLEIPIIVGEFAHVHPHYANDTICDVKEEHIMAECQRLGIGYYAWAWNNHIFSVAQDWEIDNDSQLTEWGSNLIYNHPAPVSKTSFKSSIFEQPRAYPLIEIEDSVTVGFEFISQKNIVISGSVHDPSGVKSLIARYNGKDYNLTLGVNATITPRLDTPNSFIFEAPLSNQNEKTDEVVLTATNKKDVITTKKIQIQVLQTEPEKDRYLFTWDKNANVRKFTQKINGDWVQHDSKLKPKYLASNNAIALGDLRWTDYEMEATFSTTPNKLKNISDVSFVLRWNGYEPTPTQPSNLKSPSGITIKYKENSLEVLNSQGVTVQTLDYNLPNPLPNYTLSSTTLDTDLSYSTYTQVNPNFIGYSSSFYTNPDIKQPWSNNLDRATFANFNPGNLRYPDLNLANYWDWKEGNIDKTLDPEKFQPPQWLKDLILSDDGEFSYELEDFKNAAIATNCATTFVLNTVTDNEGAGAGNSQYQIDMLSYWQNLGMPINYVELGFDLVEVKGEGLISLLPNEPNPDISYTPKYNNIPNEYTRYLRSFLPFIRKSLGFDFDVAVVAGSSSFDADERVTAWNDDLNRNFDYIFKRGLANAISIPFIFDTNNLAFDSATPDMFFNEGIAQWQNTLFRNCLNLFTHPDAHTLKVWVSDFKLTGDEATKWRDSWAYSLFISLAIDLQLTSGRVELTNYQSITSTDTLTSNITRVLQLYSSAMLGMSEAKRYTLNSQNQSVFAEDHRGYSIWLFYGNAGSKAVVANYLSTPLEFDARSLDLLHPYIRTLATDPKTSNVLPYGATQTFSDRVTIPPYSISVLGEPHITNHYLKARVDSFLGGDCLYRAKTWDLNNTEPTEWSLTQTEPASLNDSGSIAFFCNNILAKLGEVSVKNKPLATNILPLVRSEDVEITLRDGNKIDLTNYSNDPDGFIMPSSVKIVDAPRKGTYSLDENGILTYNYQGLDFESDTIGFTVRDNRGTESNIGILTIKPKSLFPTDSFAEPILNSRWQIINPIGGSAVVEGSKLKMTIPATPLSLLNATEKTALRVIQPIDPGNFEMITRNNSEIVFEKMQRGLYIEQDATNWYSFNLRKTSTGKYQLTGYGVKNNVPVGLKDVTLPVGAENPQYYRVRRVGDKFVSSYSPVGYNWIPFDEFTFDISPKFVGFWIGNTSGKEQNTLFNYIQNTIEDIPIQSTPDTFNSSIETTIREFTTVDLNKYVAIAQGRIDVSSFEISKPPERGSYNLNNLGILQYFYTGSALQADSIGFQVSNTAGDKSEQALLTFNPTKQIESDNFESPTKTDTIWSFSNTANPQATAYQESNRLKLYYPADIRYSIWDVDQQLLGFYQNKTPKDFEIETQMRRTADIYPGDSYGVYFKSIANNDQIFIGVRVADSTTKPYKLIVKTGKPGSSNTLLEFLSASLLQPPEYFRIKRLGDFWQVSYSYDRSTWIIEYSLTIPIEIDQLGFTIAGGNYSVRRLVEFNYLHNTIEELTINEMANLPDGFDQRVTAENETRVDTQNDERIVAVENTPND